MPSRSDRREALEKGTVINVFCHEEAARYLRSIAVRLAREDRQRRITEVCLAVGECVDIKQSGEALVSRSRTREMRGDGIVRSCTR